MWQAISEQLSDRLQRPFKIQERILINKSDVHTCYSISSAQDRFFIKINQREYFALFESEAESLSLLNQAGCVHTPIPIHVGYSKEHAFLILNYLPVKPLSEDSAYELGQALAHQHLWGEQAEYGFDVDNYLRLTLQHNQWQRRWCCFYAEQRIGWQLQLCEEKGMVFGDIPTIIDNIKQRLINHHPKPALLHGDLQLNNSALSVEGPLLFDPAAYWGDRECDIAMSQLFTTFPHSFYSGYNSVYPLPDGHEQRLGLYQLYPLLNYCNLFGGQYLTQAQELIEQYELQTLSSVD